MSPERHHAATGTADVAEEQLQDRCGPDQLRSFGVLRPAEGVADGRCSLRARRQTKQFRQLEEEVLRDAADSLDHLGCVARKVTLEHLIDAAGMLQRYV